MRQQITDAQFIFDVEEDSQWLEEIAENSYQNSDAMQVYQWHLGNGVNLFVDRCHGEIESVHITDDNIVQHLADWEAYNDNRRSSANPDGYTLMRWFDEWGLDPAEEGAKEFVAEQCKELVDDLATAKIHNGEAWHWGIRLTGYGTGAAHEAAEKITDEIGGEARLDAGFAIVWMA